jgi:hypothetical protein
MIFCHSNPGSGIFYSYLSASTGLTRDALNEWKNTVALTTAMATINAIAKNQKLIGILYEKLLSH